MDRHLGGNTLADGIAIRVPQKPLQSFSVKLRISFIFPDDGPSAGQQIDFRDPWVFVRYCFVTVLHLLEPIKHVLIGIAARGFSDLRDHPEGCDLSGAGHALQNRHNVRQTSGQLIFRNR
jgi:hypothetical protein